MCDPDRARTDRPRDFHARVGPDWVRAYVESRGDRLSGLSRREALKHL